MCIPGCNLYTNRHKLSYDFIILTQSTILNFLLILPYSIVFVLVVCSAFNRLHVSWLPIAMLQLKLLTTFPLRLSVLFQIVFSKLIHVVPIRFELMISFRPSACKAAALNQTELRDFE